MTREALDHGIMTGDLSTIQVLFAQPDLQHQLRATNAIILKTQPTNPTTFLLPDGLYPWFRRPATRETRDADIPLLVAARVRGDARIGASRDGRVDCGRDQPVTTRDPFVMEILLSSYAFRNMIPIDQQQRLLDRLVVFCQTPSIITLTLAHGAQLNDVMATNLRFSDASCVAMLENEGALFVGAQVVDRSEPDCDYNIPSFLDVGVDPSGPQHLILEAARNLDEFFLMLL